MSGRGPARKDYEGDGITVHWDSGRCIHSAACLNGSPAVFDTAVRPWIDPAGASADEVAATIDICPSHALTYTRTDGAAPGPGDASVVAQTAAEAGVSVTVRTNGPLVIMGPLRVLDDDGTEVASGDRHFLCRCGNSGNKPFCDGTHKRVGFAG